MARFHHLIVYQLARENTRDVNIITQSAKGFGDICNQMRRAAISVQSAIAEGSLATRAMFIDKLVRARAK